MQSTYKRAHFKCPHKEIERQNFYLTKEYIMGIQVRIDVQNEEKARKDIDDFVDHYRPKVFIAVREDSGQNPHYHIYADLSSDSKQVTKIRGWWRYREYKKDALCVKKWGDESDDLTYFFKGDKDDESHPVDCYRTTIDVFTQQKYNEVFWNENARLMHRKKQRESTNLVKLLIVDCEAKGAKSQMEVIRVFAETRVGLAGLCRFKHGPIIKSAWLHLNRSEPAHLDHMVETWCHQIFSED